MYWHTVEIYIAGLAYIEYCERNEYENYRFIEGGIWKKYKINARWISISVVSFFFMKLFTRNSI